MDVFPFYCFYKWNHGQYNLTLTPVSGRSSHWLISIPGYKYTMKTKEHSEQLWGFEELFWHNGVGNTLWSSWGGHWQSHTLYKLDYINFCVENAVPTRTVQCFSNNKPWTPLVCTPCMLLHPLLHPPSYNSQLAVNLHIHCTSFPMPYPPAWSPCFWGTSWSA